MTKKLLIRKIHRYIALIVGLQLLLWSVGGLFFSLIPISEIHGNHLKADKVKVDWKQAQGVKGLNEIYGQLKTEGHKLEEVTQIKLEPIVDRFYYQVMFADKSTIWVDAINAKIKAKYTDSEIIEIARAHSKNAGSIIDVEWITETTKTNEYRGKPLPVYKVTFDGSDNLNMYLDGYTGKINSMRTSNWRIFDFFWMLHVMDYDTRDNFNHLLLQVFATLAVITSLSGIVLWIVSYRRRPRAA